jgi:two-component system invasion response regulator UvrY
MTRVFIADDHVLIREGLKKILEEESGFAVAGEAQNASEVLENIGKLACDILILDLSLPDKPGLEVLKEVKKTLPNLRVLVLSMFPEKQFALRALRAGADGYLTKESAAAELVRALRRLAAGKRYISETLSNDLAEMMQRGDSNVAHEGLSDREFQVLRMIGAGKSVAEIAVELNLSVSTVNTHRIHVLEKMKMQSNADLIRYVIENKLAE